eukprot:COSAG01_NODE_6562_length_3608_cov_4.538900_5_plen_152_part_00
MKQLVGELCRRAVFCRRERRVCCPSDGGDLSAGVAAPFCVLCCETNGRAHGSSSPRCPCCGGGGGCCFSVAQELLGVSAQELEAVDDEEQPQAVLAALIEARARARATGASHAQRKRQFVEHFRNTSLILDCVSCEKCKLWGKLQVLGVGT